MKLRILMPRGNKDLASGRLQFLERGQWEDVSVVREEALVIPADFHDPGPDSAVVELMDRPWDFGIIE